MNGQVNKKALIFFSAGVGDAILLVPLVNQLKKDGYRVTGLFTSPFHCESVFENTDLFDAVEIKKNKFSLLLFCILKLKQYNKVFLNHFAFSRSNLSAATLLGKKVFCNHNSFTSLQSSNAISFIEPIANTHDALQNVFLNNTGSTLSDLNFDLNYKPQNTTTFKLSKNYIVLQISSANNKAPYKNWPVKNWIELFDQIEKKLPDTQLIILGDDTELALNSKLGESENKNIVSLIGKTSLNDVMEIIYHSKFYIGLDSGLMHIAVALNKPTFTLWGASDPTLYGYNWLGEKHKVVSLNLPCAPCSAWINPNTTRVTDPLKCPDFKCIRGISVEFVATELNAFLKII